MADAPSFSFGSATYSGHSSLLRMWGVRSMEAGTPGCRSRTSCSYSFRPPEEQGSGAWVLCRRSVNDVTLSPTAAAGVQHRPSHPLWANGETHSEVPTVYPPASGTSGVRPPPDPQGVAIDGGGLLGRLGLGLIHDSLTTVGLWSHLPPSVEPFTFHFVFCTSAQGRKGMTAMRVPGPSGSSLVSMWRASPAQALASVWTQDA
jgi:hypothetical protein